MKLLFSALLIIAATQITKAQNNTINGSVQDETGRLLHFVHIGDSKHKNAVFSDSVGNFTIPVYPDSRLTFQLEGFRDTSVNAENISAGAQIVLKSVADVPVQTSNLSVRAVIQDGGAVVIPRRNPNIVGSRYQLDAFAHGFFTDMKGKQVYNPYYLFNYEKISGYLLLTVDRSNIMKIEKDQVKSFTIYDNRDRRFEFERLPAIDSEHYVQVLAKGDKYKVCKLVKTKFYAADFAHTAAGGVGKEYDEYADDAEYYLLDVKSSQVQKLSLKKKSLKAGFAKEEDKVNKFLTENSSNIDDTYLSNLGDYMNR